MNKLLSVSVAAYNVEKFIDEVLKPFTEVKSKELVEVLIIDDGATDNTIEKAMKYVRDYPDVFRTVHKENGGWGSTVNTGIEEATGEYFKLLDGDDYYDPKALENLLKCLTEHRTDLILTPYVRFCDEDGTVEYVENKLFENDSPIEIGIDDLPATPFCLEMYSVTVKTKLLKENPPSITEHCFYTDNEFVAKACINCKTVTVAPYYVYWYRTGRNGQSVSIEGMKKHCDEFELVLKKMMLFARDEITNARLQEIFFNRYSSLSYYYYEMLLVLGPDKQYKDKIISFDKWLKENFSDIYKSIKYAYIILLRKTKFIGYSLISRHVKDR